MNSRLLLLTAAVVSMLFNGVSKAAPFDTGFRQWSQPNSITFVGREWGDEFFWWAETETGHRYLQLSNGWYYYATLDANGDFAPTSYRVGIDAPPANSYKLERLQARTVSIDQSRERFNTQIELNAQRFLQKLAQARALGQPVVKRLAVILVEFPDAPHFQDPQHPRRPFGYLRADFDGLLFSQNFWYAPAESSLVSPHPEQHPVYGSMRDYWWQMSRPNGSAGALILTGNVVNPQDGNGIPLWIEMRDSIEHYDFETLVDEAKSRAIQLGYLDTTQYNAFAIIYAGISARLWHRAGADSYIAEERRYGAFEHIGLHCHEFGHLLGFADEYLDETQLSWFDLMSHGCYNGPGNLLGECPATPAPLYRVQCGWVTPVVLDNDASNLVVRYDYEHPIFYRINPINRDPRPGYHDEHFLFETRLRQGFDLYTPGPPSTFFEQSGTLMVWRHNSGTDRIAILGGSTSSNPLLLFFPGERATNFQDYNDFTPIAPHYQDGYLPHFALNGIHRNDTTNFTHINSYLIPAGIGVIRENATWPTGVSNLNTDIRVLKGATLTIPPGAELIFGPRRNEFVSLPGIYVYPDTSSLVANGTTVRSSASTRGSWRGIVASGRGTVQLDNSIIQNAVCAVTSEQPLGNVRDLQVINCSTGLVLSSGGATLSTCTFRNNQSALIISGPENVQATGCHFTNNGVSISVGGASPILKFNDFSNGTVEIHISEGSRPLIANNLLVGNQTFGSYGIRMDAKESVRPLIVNNTISGYRYGCLVDPRQIPGDPSARPEVRNNILYLNNESYSEDGGTIYGDGALRFNNVYNWDRLYYDPPNTPPHEGNIEWNPTFEDPANGKYSLSFFSRSIDTGNPADDFSQEPEPNGGRINQGHHGNTPLATRSFNIVAGGSISENTQWQGNILIESNLSVEEPATLTISPGSTVWAAQNSGIDVLGTLNAIGHVPEPPLDSIKFKSEVPGQSWSGIALRKQVEGSTFRYCSITGSSTGIAIEASAPTIERCLIDNCSTGLDVYTIDAHAQPVINDNEIRNCKYGVIFHQAFPLQVRRNRIHDNDIGIYTFQSSPVFHHNVVENNRYVGVYSEASDPRFGDNIADDRGCNIIRNNLLFGGIADLYVSGGSAFLGYYDGNQFYGGFNSVFSRQEEPRCVVTADNNAFVMAHLTWWGISPPPQWLFCLSNAKLDYSKPLDGEPVECNKTFTEVTLPPDNEEAILQAALVDRGHHNYATALNTYSTFVTGRPNSVYVRRALRELRQTYREHQVWSNDTTRQQQLLSSLSTIAGNHPNTPVRKLAQTLWAEELHAKRNWNGAVTKYQQIIQTQPNTINERVAWYSLFSIAAYGMRDTASARNVLATLQTKYPGDPHTAIAKIRFAGLTRTPLPPLSKSYSPDAQAQAALPTEYALQQNYPNPFNPTTTIKYQLPQNAHVVLRVYDILGREVATLVEESKDAGFHSIQFQTSGLASGVYFYRLQAGQFTDTKKFVLLR
jgi:hypothetical protein